MPLFLMEDICSIVACKHDSLIACYNGCTIGTRERERDMGNIDRSEKFTVFGYLAGFAGVAFCADSFGCVRAYGYTDGTVVEFVIGVACLIAATVMLYIAGMLRDRRVREEFERRRIAREKRRAERERRRR